MWKEAYLKGKNKMIKRTHKFGKKPKKQLREKKKLGASMQSSFSVSVKDIKNENINTK